MAFQDFAELSLRRRKEKAQKQRNFFIICIVVGILLLALIGGGIFAFIYVRKHDNKSSSSSSPSKDNKNSKVGKAIKSLCTSTSFQNKCIYALTHAAKKDPDSNHSNDFINSAILAAKNELKSAFNKTSSFNFDNPKAKEAFEDCKVLF